MDKGFRRAGARTRTNAGRDTVEAGVPNTGLRAKAAIRASHYHAGGVEEAGRSPGDAAERSALELRSSYRIHFECVFLA